MQAIKQTYALFVIYMRGNKYNPIVAINLLIENLRGTK